MQQTGLSRIDFVARCAAGERHDICLRKLEQLQQELQGVIDERWPGATYTELCVAHELGLEGVPLSDCEQWRDRGEAQFIAPDGLSVPLAHLLGSAASESPLESAVQTKAQALQLFRGLAAGIDASAPPPG